MVSMVTDWVLRQKTSCVEEKPELGSSGGVSHPHVRRRVPARTLHTSIRAQSARFTRDCLELLLLVAVLRLHTVLSARRRAH